MNAIELTNELNALIGKALKDGIGKQKMTPSDLVGCLELQKTQLVMQFMAVAAARQAEATASKIVTLGEAQGRIARPQ